MLKVLSVFLAFLAFPFIYSVQREAPMRILETVYLSTITGSQIPLHNSSFSVFLFTCNVRQWRRLHWISSALLGFYRTNIQIEGKYSTTFTLAIKTFVFHQISNNFVMIQYQWILLTKRSRNEDVSVVDLINQY